MSDTVDQLTTPLTFDEIRATIYSVIASTGATTTNWKPGAVMRTFISAVAIVLVGLSSLIALIARSAFLPLATGEWLRLVAFYVYNVVRIEATFATGYVTLTNAGGAVFTADPGDLVVRNPTTKKLYTNVEAFTLGSLTTLSGVAIAALEVGSASTSYAAEITEMVTVWTAVSVSNPLPAIGADIEEDQSLRLRCLEKLGALSPNGPSDAYGYIARSSKRADGSSINITRVRALPDGVGGVDVYVASAAGLVTGLVGDLTSDLGIIDDQLQRYATPLCVNCRTQGVIPHSITVSYSVWLYNTSGLSSLEIQAAITDELIAYFAGLPIGGVTVDGESGAVYASEIQAVIARARTATGAPLPIIRADLLSPTSNIAIADNEIPVLGVVTPYAVTQVSVKGV